MVVIAAHKPVLEKLGLTSVDAVRRYHGELVKNQRGRRDILRIRTTDEQGTPLVLYLKRIWRPYRKDGLRSLLRRGRVWSLSRIEWHNMQALNRFGFPTADLVAYGEEVGPFWERFSFILTRAAPARETVEDFLARETNLHERRRVIESLARFIRDMHDKGLASPDLFARHFFVDAYSEPAQFFLIDMARLDRAKQLGNTRRARDLAALHIGLPLRFCTMRERLRFLRTYEQHQSDSSLRRLIADRSLTLLQRTKFHDFWTATAPTP